MVPAPASAARVIARTLTPDDIARHAKLGIDSELLERAGVRRVTDREAREVLALNGKAGDFAGIEYPYIDPRTNRRVTSRIRLDLPPVSAGTSTGKYRACYGDRQHLYFPAGAGEVLQNTKVPVVLVESEKAALSATSAARRLGRSVLAVATGGCWNWRGRIGKTEDAKGARVDEKGPLPDFQLIDWTDRVVVIGFDARPNDSVRAARRQLASFLRQLGADVRHAHLPDADERINGPDDYIGAYGDAAFFHLIDTASAEEFVRDDRGRVLRENLENVRLGLSKLRAQPALDAFSRDVLVQGVPLDDVMLDRLWVQLDDHFKFRPSKDTLRTVIVAEAHHNAQHPVREYLDALRWDGRHRLDSWLVTYAGAPDSEYVRTVSGLLLTAAVRRVRQPGCKFDELVIIEGPQGTGKSTALRTLCPREEWFSDDLPLGVSSKEVIERTSGRWIIEAAELHGNRGREVEQLKAFLSRQVDGPVRLAYGRLPVTVPRQFVLIGTTNASLAYLKDATGARRFWPVAIGGFDVEALARDRDQLWAEASVREASRASIRLPAELWGVAGQHQEDRRAFDPWEPLIEPLLDGDGTEASDAVPVDRIWSAIGVEASRLDNRHADRVAAIVQRHGFTAKRKRRLGGGAPVWCWVRGE